MSTHTKTTDSPVESLQGTPLVLVLDDDAELRAMLRKVLVHASFKVIDAADVPTALKYCSVQRPDLVIADLMLPKMDGEAFLTEFRRTYASNPPPVILLSASMTRVQVAQRMEIVSTLAKPFDLEELIALAKKLTQSSVSRG